VRINTAIPENEVSKPILDASLEAVTRLDEQLLEKGVPTFREAKNRVSWAPEPPGQEHFDHAGIVLGRGKGDCDDLAPWHAASLRHTGEDPRARAVVKRSGHRKWHAVVKRGDGSYDDPSKEAGMRRGVPHFGVSGAVLPLLGCNGQAVGDVGSYIDMPKLAVRPIMNPVTSEVEAWQARADLPWHWSPGKSPTDVAMASLHRSPIASQAIAGALEGVIVIGEASNYVSEESLDAAEAIGWMLNGADYEEVAEHFGDDMANEAHATIDGLFKKIGRGLKKISKPLVKAITSKMGRSLISMIPGVGPAAASALDYAGPALNAMAASKGKKGKPRKARKKSPFGMIKAKKTLRLRKRKKPSTRKRTVRRGKAKRTSKAGKKQMVICYLPEGR